MDEKTKHLVASGLVNAYYIGSERRQGFLGEDRRSTEPASEELRNLRSPTITPGEVFTVYQSFLKMMDED